MKKNIKKPITILLLVITFICNAQCFTNISTRYNHNLGIKPNGTIWGWGWGVWGQLNNTTEIDEYLPITISSLSTWQSVKGGTYNTFAIKTDGTLWGCGNNEHGNFGIGSTNPYLTIITQIGNSSNWKEIAPSDFFTVALKTDNSLWAWGQNDGYQMGNNTCCTDQLSPIQVGTATDWKTIATSDVRSAFAIKNNGTLWCWGSNIAFLLGDSSVSARTVPVQHNPDTNWDKISLGSAHILAIKTTGALWSWGGGSGETGQDPTIPFGYATPFNITGNWKAVGAGQNFSMGIKTDGTLWAWGKNDVGQLGDGTTTNRHIPIQLGTATNWDSVACGYQHTVALRTDGSLWSWGTNDFGQLGNGTTTAVAVPNQVVIAGCALETETFAMLTSLNVSPNPAQNDITIQYKGNETVDHIGIYDVLGKEVYATEALGNTAFMTTFSVAQLPSGMYVVVLKNKNKTVVSTKLVKE